MVLQITSQITSQQIISIRHHSYDAHLITTWCQLVLLGAISLRAAPDQKLMLG